MKQFVKKLLIKISSNARFQRLLERNVMVSQYLMGIGSGSSPYSSGEKVIIEKLKQHAKPNQSLCIFDVGSNKGQFLDLLTHGLQGFTYSIHAFEPSQFTYKVLCDNAKDYSNVRKSVV